MVMVICFSLFFLGVLVVLVQGARFFMILLSFEFITLVLFISLLMGLVVGSGVVSGFLVILFLVMSVCEASLGLGLLVGAMRTQGYEGMSVKLSLIF